MEVKLDPRAAAMIESTELRKDWKPIRARLEAAEGHWVVVATTKRFDKGLREDIDAKLRGVGCIAQIVVGAPANQGPLANPDRVVFARIPRSRRSPSGKLF